jgi:hypothetical protein
MIRELRDGDVDAFVKLRHEALLDSPLAFVASPGDDRSSAEEVREQLQRATEFVIMGAFRPQLVGAVDRYRDRLLKSPTHHSIRRYDGSFCCIDGQLSRKKLIVSVMT